MQVAADAVPETHADVDKLIWNECHRYSLRTGVPLEVAHELAEESFADAFVRHDRGRGKFTTCLVIYIRNRFRFEANRQARVIPTVPDEVFEFCTADPDLVFDQDGFTEDLSNDSAKIVRLLTTQINGKPKKLLPKDTPIGRWMRARPRPPELAAIEDLVRRGRTRTARGALEDLLSRMGWTLDRISESFAEIGRALR